LALRQIFVQRDDVAIMGSNAESWLQSILKTIPGGLVLLDAEWRVRWCNKVFLEWSAGFLDDGVVPLGQSLQNGGNGNSNGGNGNGDGLEPEPLDNLDSLQASDIKQKAFADYFPSEQHFDLFRENAEYSLKRGHAARTEVSLQFGEEPRITFWGEVHLTECHPDLPASYILYLNDKSSEWEIKRELEARLASQSYLKKGIQDFLLRFNAEGELIYQNPAAEKLTFPGTQITAIFSKVDDNPIGGIWSAFKSGQNTEAEIPASKFKQAGSNVYIAWSFKRLVTDEGDFDGASAIGHDITEQHLMSALVKRAGLTQRESEVLRYVADGYTNLNISALLGISESGVKFHLRNIFQKTSVGSRTELISLILPSSPSSLDS
jgi:DNA-binding CsgD family transcriptional regulator/PAS domain-containing protein